MAKFRQCRECGANLDPCEQCDCTVEQKNPAPCCSTETGQPSKGQINTAIVAENTEDVKHYV